MNDIKVNPHAEIRRQIISEDHHCVIVDDFLQAPRDLVDFAAGHAGNFSTPDSGYPGQQLVVNNNAMNDIYRFLRSNMTKYFPILRGGASMWALLSMVTQRPHELSNLQRICHTDPIPRPERTIYAALLYLFENEDLGGTSFFRYRNRKLLSKAEAIDRDDRDKGLKFLQDNFPTYREPASYMTESNDIADLLCTIPARFNRLVLYWGGVPHSGAITSPDLLSNDTRKGRLTLNIFADVLPK